MRQELACLFRMPRLQHTKSTKATGAPIYMSDFAQWLSKQPEMIELMVSIAKSSGLLGYDNEAMEYYPLTDNREDFFQLLDKRKQEKKQNRRAARANDVAPKAWAIAKATGEYDYYKGIPFGKFWKAWRAEHSEPKSPITMRKWLDWSGEFEFLDGGKMLYMGPEAKAKRETIAQAAVEKIEDCLNACHDQGLTPTPANCIMAVDAFIVNPEIAAQQIKPFLERQSVYIVSGGVIVPVSKDNDAQATAGGQNQEVDDDF